jgi:serine/threonine protein kinase
MRLVVTAGPDKGRVIPITSNPVLRVGRSKKTPTQFTDPRISRFHCQIERRGGQILLTDCDSASGTFVNGERLTGPHELRPGDVIGIGDSQLLVQTGEGAEQKTLPPELGAAPAAYGKPSRLTELVGTPLSHFEVGPVLAKGATGLLFRARDTKDNREVALKVLQPEVTQNDEEMQRFVRAMKTMMPLRHPNLVAIYGAGKSGPYCWIAMELIEGESLAAVIPRIGVAGMLDWRYSLRVAVHIARALQFAGEHHIIHRNITPHNILVQNSDKCFKLGDLMLAKALEGTLAQQITRPGELLGDVTYMSPERTQGTGAVDGRSDIYSLGATAYALLTGRPPFLGDSLPETIRKIRQEEPAKLKKYHLSIPEAFEGIVLQMLAKRPESRFQNAADLLTHLERVAKFQNVAV